MNSRILIIISFLVIGAGMYGMFFQDTRQQPQPIIKSESSPAKKYKVYMANSEIKRGEIISRNKIAIMWLEEKQANYHGIDKNIDLNFEHELFARKNIPASSFIYPEDTVNIESNDYIDFVIKPEHIPYPLQVDASSVIGGVVSVGTNIDILALSSSSQNLAENRKLNNSSFKRVSLRPVLTDIKVLKITSLNTNNREQSEVTGKVALVLELTAKQVATLTVAEKIAALEVHKATSGAAHNEMSANAGDVLEDYKAIKEFRASNEKIN